MICTVTPITNSKQVENYYTRDDYYSRNAKREDFWQGKLSEKVGLSNKAVDKKHFAALIEMTDKRKNEGQKPTLGVDITFSCPKSVSILQAVAPEYREIVNRCLSEVTDEMITLIEEKFIRTRRGYGGKSLEYTQNILAAGINHEINRNEELDRHTHIFIPNMTLTQDGKILTIDIKYLMKQQKLFGAIARAKLVSKLQREGIKLEFDDADKGIYRIKGISREIEEYFSQRSAEIIREQKKYGENNAVATQIATLTTRKAKNHKVDLDKIFSDTSNFLKNSDVKIQRQEKISPADIKTKKQIFSDALTDLELKNFSFTRLEIIQKVLNAGLNAQIQVEEVEKFINRSQRIRRTTDKNGEEIFISLANEKCEQDMLDLLQLGQGNGQAIDSLTADRLLEKVIVEKKYTPNQEQVTAILTALTSKNSYVATQGLAGGGKTYFVKILHEICEKCDIPIRGAAFAGAAADELANDSGISNCNTIDSLLLKYENESLRNLHKPINTDFEFKRDFNFRGLKKDSKGGFLVVDEFGMVDDIHARALMQLCAAKGWKLLAIGDYDQIPAINVGDAHRFLINHGATTCFLQNITRQRENLELLQVVKESVLGNVDKSFDLLGNKIQQIENRQQCQIATVDEYFSALKKYSQEKIAVATLTNSERIFTNEMIRRRLIQQGNLSEGRIFHISNGDAKHPAERDIEISVG
ncbi:MAG: relaxase domain-containing protein, partial [Selenomonadaceae bacterium]|nr:relaxase domain-containing protein [Selenomonadaceae bacterium]